MLPSLGMMCNGLVKLGPSHEKYFSHLLKSLCLFNLSYFYFLELIIFGRFWLFVRASTLVEKVAIGHA